MGEHSRPEGVEGDADEDVTEKKDEETPLLPVSGEQHAASEEAGTHPPPATMPLLKLSREEWNTEFGVPHKSWHKKDFTIDYIYDEYATSRLGADDFLLQKANEYEETYKNTKAPEYLARGRTTKLQDQLSRTRAEIGFWTWAKVCKMLVFGCVYMVLSYLVPFVCGYSGIGFKGTNHFGIIIAWVVAFIIAGSLFTAVVLRLLPDEHRYSTDSQRLPIECFLPLLFVMTSVMGLLLGDNSFAIKQDVQYLEAGSHAADLCPLATGALNNPNNTFNGTTAIWHPGSSLFTDVVGTHVWKVGAREDKFCMSVVPVLAPVGYGNATCKAAGSGDPHKVSYWAFFVQTGDWTTLFENTAYCDPPEFENGAVLEPATKDREMIIFDNWVVSWMEGSFVHTFKDAADKAKQDFFDNAPDDLFEDVPGSRYVLMTDSPRGDLDQVKAIIAMYFSQGLMVLCGAIAVTAMVTFCSRQQHWCCDPNISIPCNGL